ncbi:MAG: hypothetical protein IPL61_30025 [Myxococcales bacterium]|nr:hypothetical protein [Myxococcales bacterium]
MNKLPLKLTIIPALCTALLLPAIAAADDDVPPISGAPDGELAVRRGLQGPEGMLMARVTLAVNLSADLAGEPISLAPDVYYAVSDRLQLGLIHDGPMRWQARPGLGLCLSGTDGGCPHVYDNVGFDVMYGLIYGTQLHLSVHGGLLLTSFDPTTAMMPIGAAVKLHLTDAVAITVDPQLGFALSDRDVTDDALFAPVDVSFQLDRPTTLKLLTGVVGSLQHLGDTYQVPVGLGVVRNLTEHIDLGVRFSFDNLLGKQPPGVDAADTRSLALLLNLRS